MDLVHANAVREQMKALLTPGTARTHRDMKMDTQTLLHLPTLSSKELESESN